MSLFTLTELPEKLRGIHLDDPNLSDGMAIEEAAEAIEQLRGNLSLAEEGLANYQQENERLRQILAHRLQELYQAKWLIRNGEKHFGSLWRNATAEDIRAVAERSSEPQSGEQHGDSV
jgi:ABC-type transporter MlaC component